MRQQENKIIIKNCEKQTKIIRRNCANINQKNFAFRENIRYI